MDPRPQVLHDVLRSLFEAKFIEELFKPQELYPNTVRAPQARAARSLAPIAWLDTTER